MSSDLNTSLRQLSEQIEAAKKGDSVAQRKVGLAFSEGGIIKQDNYMSSFWLNLSEESRYYRTTHRSAYSATRPLNFIAVEDDYARLVRITPRYKIEVAAEKVEQEIQLKREEEERRHKAEEARRKAEEARQKAEEAKRKAEEIRRKTEEAKRKAEESRRKIEEAKRKAEEERMRREAEKKRKREEEERRRAEEKRRRAEEQKRKDNVDAAGSAPTVFRSLVYAVMDSVARSEDKKANEKLTYVLKITKVNNQMLAMATARAAFGWDVGTSKIKFGKLPLTVKMENKQEALSLYNTLSNGGMEVSASSVTDSGITINNCF